MTRPLYWSDSSPITIQFMFQFRDLDSVADHPVTGVSWHEAEAFARFAGKRLPTEAEWEVAASPVNEGNFGAAYAGTTPVGAFPKNKTTSGCFDMTGNLWEWTSSTFGPYPGFKAHPYPEYSELWFDGDHRVLKGGSWMTRSPLSDSPSATSSAPASATPSPAFAAPESRNEGTLYRLSGGTVPSPPRQIPLTRSPCYNSRLLLIP